MELQPPDRSDKARELRSRSTESEALLWAQLRNITSDKHKLPKGGNPDVPVPGITAFFSLSHRLARRSLIGAGSSA